MNADGRRTRMNADPSFVFNPRLSALIGDHRFGRLFQHSHECARHTSECEYLCFLPLVFNGSERELTRQALRIPAWSRL